MGGVELRTKASISCRLGQNEEGLSDVPSPLTRLAFPWLVLSAMVLVVGEKETRGGPYTGLRLLQACVCFGVAA